MSEGRPRRRRDRSGQRADRERRPAHGDQQGATTPHELGETGSDHPRHGDLAVHELPHETLSPITLAAGIALVGFGVLTSPLFSVVGIGVVGWAIWNWIGEMQHG